MSDGISKQRSAWLLHGQAEYLIGAHIHDYMSYGLSPSHQQFVRSYQWIKERDGDSQMGV
jgi:hypothetical protein